MPFIKNSTATSGLPLLALRHANTSDSGNPSAFRLSTTSLGNSGGLEGPSLDAGAGAAGAAAGPAEGCGAPGVDAADVVAGVAAVGAFFAWIQECC